MLEAAAQWLSDLPTTLAVIVSVLVGSGLSALGLLVILFYIVTLVKGPGVLHRPL